jgi:acyl carrier protein
MTMETNSGRMGSLEIRKEIRQYITDNFLRGEPDGIDDARPLITGGIFDSIDMIGLVAFLESRFEIEFQPRDIDAYSLDSVARIEELIRRKLASREANVATDCGTQP